MKYFPSIVLFSCVLILFACKKPQSSSDNSMGIIPAESSVVNAIHLQQLMDKADFEAVKQMGFFQDMLAEVKADNPLMAEVLQNPSLSGLDLEKPAFLSYNLNPEDLESVFVAMTMNIKDVKTFESFIQNNQGIIEKTGSYKTAQFDNDSQQQGVVGWNSAFAVLGFDPSGRINMTDQLKRFLEPAEDQKSVASNPEAQKFFAEKHDIQSWFSSDGLASDGNVRAAAAAAGIDPDALQGNQIRSFTDFENGQITGNSSWDLKKELVKDFGKLLKDKPGEDLTKFLPSENLVMVSSTAINPPGIDYILSQRAQSKSFINFALKEYDLSIEEIVMAFGGDLLLASYGDQDGNNDVVLITDIGKRAPFDKLLNLALEYNMMEKVGEESFQIDESSLSGLIPFPYNATFKFDDGGYLYLFKDKILISNNAGLLDQIKSGKNLGTPKEIDALVKNNNLGLFVDLIAGGDLMDPEYQGVNALELLTLSTNRKEGQFELTTKNKNENSLKTILKMVEEAYQKRENTSTEDLDEEGKQI